MKEKQNEGDANEVEKNVYDRGIAAWNIKLVNFVCNGNSKGNQSGD